MSDLNGLRSTGSPSVPFAAQIKRSGSSKGNGRSRSALTTPMAVELAPTPTPMVRIANVVNAASRRSSHRIPENRPLAVLDQGQHARASLQISGATTVAQSQVDLLADGRTARFRCKGAQLTNLAIAVGRGPGLNRRGFSAISSGLPMKGFDDSRVSGPTKSGRPPSPSSRRALG